ncbi:MAG: homocysteine S-methyltransferase [Bacteroidota bacterium]
MLLHTKQPLIIDGGLSNVLESKGFDLNHKLWTARLLTQNPEAIVAAHLAYLKAGAQCITTASYQASILGLLALGYTLKAAKGLIVQSVQLAQEAADQAWEAGIVKERPLIAASIGPYGAYLADGSEYRGNYGVSDQVLYSFHEERIQWLDQSGADVLACETIPSLQEAKVLADLLTKTNTPAWVSFSCKDGQYLNDGSCIEEAVAIFKDHPKVLAVGTNCTHPTYIITIIERVKSVGMDKKIIVYPNSGEAYHAASKSWLGLSEPYAFGAMAKAWVDSGAQIIGGCCRIGPEHIREIVEIMKEVE